MSITKTVLVRIAQPGDQADSFSTEATYMSDEEKSEIYRRSNELLRQLVRDEPEVREILDNARGGQNSKPKERLTPVADWMSSEA
jgi:hypothetical protein